MGGSKSITSVNLQIGRLIDAPEKAYKAAMREAYKNIGSGMKSVIRAYQRNIIDTKSLFNDKYLTSLGYNPRETINYRAVDPALVLSWCKANISADVSTINKYRWEIPTIEEICIEYLQDTYGIIDFSDNSLSIGGTKWFVTGTVVTGANSSDATLLKNKETTANEYASLVGVTVVSIAEGIVADNGINYWSTVLSTGPKLIPAVYMTITCPGIGSDVVSTILASYNSREYYMSLNEEDGTTRWSNTISISTHITSKGTIGLTGRYKNPYIPSDWTSRIYAEATKMAMQDKLEEVQKEIDLLLVDSLDRLVVKYTIDGDVKIKIAEIDKNIVSSVASAKAFPVIPLKENYSILNSNNNMKAILNKIGMSKSDFEDSIADGRLKNAAILFIVDINDGSPEGTKLVYETLINMVKTAVPGTAKVAATENYQLNLGFSDINMHTTLNMNISTFEGVVALVGGYVRYSESYSRQVFDSEVNRYITVTGTKTGIKKQITTEYYEEIEFDDQSQTKWSIGGYELSEKVYIPITDIGLDSLTYEESTYATALSMNIVTTSVVVTKTKWYQSGFFKFVMTIIITIAGFFTAGQAWWAYGLLAAAVVVAGTVVAILNLWGVNTGTIGTIIGVAAILVGGYTSIMDAATTSGQTLATASTLVQLAQVASQINLEGIARAIENKRLETRAELEATEEQLSEIAEETQQGLWMGVQDREPELLYAMNSTALMCNYDILYDYDGMYEGKINSIGI